MNKDEEQKRKRTEYHANPQKERERKKVEYHKNPEFQRLRKQLTYVSQKETQETDDDLKKFLEEGKYGPIFPCICCHQLFWRRNVVVAEMSAMNSEFVDKHYVTVLHRRLFKKVGRYFLCLTCRPAIRVSQRPKLCALNALHCSWEEVPKELLKINEVIYT